MTNTILGSAQRCTAMSKTSSPEIWICNTISKKEKDKKKSILFNLFFPCHQKGILFSPALMVPRDVAKHCWSSALCADSHWECNLTLAVAVRFHQHKRLKNTHTKYWRGGVKKYYFNTNHSLVVLFRLVWMLYKNIEDRELSYQCAFWEDFFFYWEFVMYIYFVEVLKKKKFNLSWHLNWKCTFRIVWK